MVKVVIFDVDGTLTDGQIAHFHVLELDAWQYEPPRIIRGRSFSTLDSKGMWLLRESGVQVWICGGDDSLHLRDRLDWIGVDGQLLDPKDKREIFYQLTQPKSEIAFMGNDVNDLPIMREVGVVACPVDAYYPVLEYVKQRGGFISKLVAGHGAVREFCDWLITRNNADRQAGGIPAYWGG